MSELLRYIIEWKDKENIVTYKVSEKKYDALRLHGDEIYKLTSKGIGEYWHCWENETGYTEDKLTDICIIWPKVAEQEAREMIKFGMEKAYQTQYPSVWKMRDIADYMAALYHISVEYDGKKQYLPSTFKMKNGTKYNLQTLAESNKINNVMNKASEGEDSQIVTIPKQEPAAFSGVPVIPRKARNNPTEKEIKIAMEIAGKKHTTLKQGE